MAELTAAARRLKYRPTGEEAGRETFVYSFGNAADGTNPYGGLTIDSSGNLYGTTTNGGLYSGGTVFELSPNNGRCCRESPVYSFGFSQNDGQHPKAGLIMDSTGNLHGTTANGGSFGGGTVFGITTNSANRAVSVRGDNTVSRRRHP